MPLFVNTNVSSLNAQRQLMSSGMELDQASERLASGRRINSAGDDAAGLAISNRQTSQIRGLDQAVRNANDGISLIQTAEGALDESTNILQRMRELAIQASNSIYSDTDRATLDAEVQQLKQELDRIAETTSFNGQTVLDGTLGTVNLQVGSESNQTVSVEIGTLDSKSLGGGTSADVVGMAMTAAINTITTNIEATDGILTINNQNVGDLTAYTDLGDVLNRINEQVSGVTVSSTLEIVASADGDGVLRNGDALDLTLIDKDGYTQDFNIAETGSMTELVAQINDVTGGTVEASLNDDGRLVLNSENAQSLQIAYTNGSVADAGIAATTYYASLTFEADQGTDYVNISVTGSDATALMEDLGVNNRTDSTITTAQVNNTGTAITEGDITINGVALSGYTAATSAGDHMLNLVAMINAKSDETGVVASTTAAAATATGATLILNSIDNTEISIDLKEGGTATYATTGLVEVNNLSNAGDNINGVEVSSVAKAQDAIDVIDAALEEINSVRADLGAVNNRLDFTISNLSNVSENASAARSRIVDADFAKETAELSRAQVLQQASQAMLAQANARPQQVLSLLN